MQVTPDQRWMTNGDSDLGVDSRLDMDGFARILFGHAAFQYLNAASELNLFELLKREPGLSAARIGTELNLDRRANEILLLGCTSLGLLVCRHGKYELAEVIGTLVGTDDWQRIRDTIAFEHYIVSPGQLDFVESLRTNTNAGLHRIPGTGADLYHRLSENPFLESVFYRYMRSWSELANPHLVSRLDLAATSRLLDCGGGDAVNAIALAKANPHLQVSVLEIPDTVPIARERIARSGIADRVSVLAGDMFGDPFPTGFDCVLFAHQMVIWTEEECVELLRKAYAALPMGGRVVIFNSMSHDAGDGPVVAALDSVYFAALPSEGGMIYSWGQHERNLTKAGFGQLRRIPCPGWTPHGIIVGSKE